MGFFFRSQPASISEGAAEIAMAKSLRMEKMDDVDLIFTTSKALLSDAEKKTAPKPNPWTMIGSVAALIVVFYAATQFDGTEIGKALLRCFEILFTGVVALFGIEVAKQK